MSTKAACIVKVPVNFSEHLYERTPTGTLQVLALYNQGKFKKMNISKQCKISMIVTLQYIA